jgi:uncharacterized protein (UPF0261 family)
MRTNVQENRQIADWIAAKLNRSTAPVTVLIPEAGLSAIDAPGQPFHDPEANAMLFDQLESQIHADDSRRVIRLPHHINDPQFAAALVDHFQQLDRQSSRDE